MGVRVEHMQKISIEPELKKFPIDPSFCGKTVNCPKDFSFH